MSSSTAPLGEALDGILARLAQLEAKAGIKGPPPPAPTTTTTTTSSSSTPSSSSSSSSGFVTAYDAYLSSVLPPFSSACSALSPSLSVLSSSLSSAWSAQRTFLEAASRARKPTDNAKLQPFFQPYMEAKKAIPNDRDDFENHRKAVGEMFGMLQWIMISPKPVDYLADMSGAVDFWTNKIRVAHKKTGPLHVSFCDALKDVQKGLVAYVKEHHMPGVSYKMNGGVDLADAASPSPSSAPAPVAAAAASAPAPAPRAGGGGGSLLAELSKKSTGDSAATGLKKVTKEQQTWRKEFSGGSGSSVVSASKSAPKKAAPAKSLGPPVFEFKDQGMKWVVECQTSSSNPNGVLTVNVTDPKQQVYIYKCDGATIDIKGKCKGVVVDTATKCNILCDTVISALEVVNGKRLKLQVRGVCPSVAIDKTDGCLTYLSAEAAPATTFVTSKSSEMNVSWPDKDGEYQEKAIPEQFQHKLDVEKGTISSEISDLYSH